MNFDDAIKAHSAWKMKLSTYIGKPDGSLKVADIEPDNKCELGKWIYSEGAKYSGVPEYATLKSEHTKFHKCAASVVKKADAGENVTQEIALGGKSDFAQSSTAVVGAIMKMRAKTAT